MACCSEIAKLRLKKLNSGSGINCCTIMNGTMKISNRVVPLVGSTHVRQRHSLSIYFLLCAMRWQWIALLQWSDWRICFIWNFKFVHVDDAEAHAGLQCNTKTWQMSNFHCFCMALQLINQRFVDWPVRGVYATYCNHFHNVGKHYFSGVWLSYLIWHITMWPPRYR